MNEILRLTDALQIDEHWPFFFEGMTMLNDPRGAKASYSPETFFALLCRVIGMGDKGLVFIVRSSEQKTPLAFFVAFEANTFMADKCLFLVELYSNRLSKTAVKEGHAFCERHARKLGLKDIKSASRRFNGGALRLFEDKWGFRREYQTFTKTV